MTLKSQIPITQKYSGTEHSFYTFRSQSNDPLPLTSYTPNIMLHINASNITTYGSIVPSSCNVYDLGSSNYRFRDLYLSGNTIDLGGTRISRDSSTGGMKITSLTTNEPVDIKAKHVYAASNLFTSNVVVYGNIQFNNVSLKNNVQVTPVRQVFYTQENQTVFTLSTSGIYGGHASNVQIFQGSSLLSYYTSNQTDYSLSLLYNQNPPTTVYTVTLTQGIPYGTYVDITVWPTLLPESTPQGFVYQNVVLDATSFTTFATQGSSIYYNNGNVGIGTNVPTSKLDVRGTIVCSNIQVIGDFVTLNTVTSNTEQIVVENAGTGPALKVTQSGPQPVAEFYDTESGMALFVGNGGNVGIGTNVPQLKLDIVGDINVQGNFYKHGNLYPGGDTLPVGTIVSYYSSNLIDPSWLICDGATYNRMDYVELANFLGVNPAASTFMVPDLRDKFLKGKNADVIGATGGSASTTLSVANLPPHTHTGTTDGGGSHSHTLPFNSSSRSYGWSVGGGTAGWVENGTPNTSTEPNHTHTFTTSGTTGATSTPFTNLPPYTTVIYIIKAKNNQYYTPIRNGDYWTSNNNNLLYQSGSIGIGTTVPLQSLDINGSMVVRGNIGIGTTLPSQPFHLVSQGNSVVMDSRGNVGIGTVSPQYPLHITGNINCTGALYMNNTKVSYIPGTTSSILFLITPANLSSYRNTLYLYDNEGLIPNAHVQTYGMDAQWYTLENHPNQISEQIQECLTYWLKNRPTGHCHHITLITKTTADSSGTRMIGVKQSTNRIWVFGGFGSGAPISWESARDWAFSGNVTISKY